MIIWGECPLGEKSSLRTEFSPDEINLCYEHDLFLQHLGKSMAVNVKLRVCRHIYIQHNADTVLLNHAKNTSAAKQSI